MSALAVDVFDSIITKGSKLTTTAATTVYANTAANEGSATAATKLDNCTICNTSAGGVTVIVTWYDLSATTAYAIYSGGTLAANTTLMIDRVLSFKPGDELRITAGTANTLEVLVTTSTAASRTSRGSPSL